MKSKGHKNIYIKKIRNENVALFSFCDDIKEEVVIRI